MSDNRDRLEHIIAIARIIDLSAFMDWVVNSKEYDPETIKAHCSTGQKEAMKKAEEILNHVERNESSKILDFVDQNKYVKILEYIDRNKSIIF